MDNKVSLFSNTDEGLNAFVSACDDMLGAKYLLAERKISAVLAAIADCERLYRLFADALKGYNRLAEFKKSQVTVGSRKKLVPPQNQQKLMAFVFCLLMEVDTGKRSLRELLDEFFYHTNPNEEFTLFCKALIVPFRDVTEFVCINGFDSYSDDEGVDITLRDEVKAMLHRMSSLVNESVLIPSELKQDLFALARGIESSLTPNRIDLIRPLLIGYRHAVAPSPIAEQLSPLIDELTKILTAGDVL